MRSKPLRGQEPRGLLHQHPVAEGEKEPGIIGPGQSTPGGLSRQERLPWSPLVQGSWSRAVVLQLSVLSLSTVVGMGSKRLVVGLEGELGPKIS